MLHLWATSATHLLLSELKLRKVRAREVGVDLKAKKLLADKAFEVTEEQAKARLRAESGDLLGWSVLPEMDIIRVNSSLLRGQPEGRGSLEISRVRQQG